MTQWFSSDWHLGHKNILAYCPRGHGDLDSMHRDFIDRWNERVAPGDHAWVLGDVAMGKVTESLALVRQLHGELHLIPGNHDRCWRGSSRNPEKWDALYLEAGFRAIWHDPVRIDIGGRGVALSHFPYKGGGDHGPERYVEHRLDDDGGWLLCGHVHDLWRQNDRMINVGVDAWGGWPVSEYEIAEAMSAGPSHVASLTWAHRAVVGQPNET